ncbi:MAG: ATP-binding cassette domain-containing protein, partial [Zestosphaera sp.]
MSNTLLELKDVEAGYGVFRVLHGVSLKVDKGEIVALVGPNGAGKTTTLKTIVGLTNLFKGEIVF